MADERAQPSSDEDAAAAPPNPPAERPASFRDAPANVSIVVANSDTFKGTPAEGVTTISTGHAGSRGPLEAAGFRAPVTVAEQNARAAAASIPPAPRTQGASAPAREAAPVATATPATGPASPAASPAAAAPAPAGNGGMGARGGRTGGV